MAGSFHEACRFSTSCLSIFESGFALGSFCSDLDHQNAIFPGGRVASPLICFSVTFSFPVVFGV